MPRQDKKKHKIKSILDILDRDDDGKISEEEMKRYVEEQDEDGYINPILLYNLRGSYKIPAKKTKKKKNKKNNVDLIKQANKSYYEDLTRFI